MRFLRELFRAKGSPRVYGVHIFEAARQGKLRKAQALLRDNPHLVNGIVNSAAQTLLHSAALEGRKDVVKLLLSSNAQVDAQDRNGKTPLYVAAEKGHRDVVELLLAYKADVNAKTADDKVPLHDAASNGHDDAVELLLANRADVNAKDKDNNIPCTWPRHRATRMLWDHCWRKRPMSTPRTKTN